MAKRKALQPGDLCNCPGNGECRCLRQTKDSVVVITESGKVLTVKRNCIGYIPQPKQIREECETIRHNWGAVERNNRLAPAYQKRRIEFSTVFGTPLLPYELDEFLADLERQEKLHDDES